MGPGLYYKPEFQRDPECRAICEARSLDTRIAKAQVIWNYPVGSRKRKLLCDAVMYANARAQAGHRGASISIGNRGAADNPTGLFSQYWMNQYAS